MKKLMIAAALLASTVAVADDLCDEILGGKDGCTLYKVQFKFKTLQGKDAKCTEAQLKKCEDDYGIQDATKGMAYLDNGNRSFDGILWQCKAACFEGVKPNEGYANAGDINYVLWEKKTETAISPKAEYTRPQQQGDAAEWKGGGNAATEQNQFEILGRYGNKAQKVTAYWKPSMNPDLADTEIVAAGFGTFDTKQMVIKSISGNAVGKLIPITVTAGGDVCTDGTDMITVLAYMCHNFKGWCCCECVNTSIVPASGTWALKYTSSKNAKLSKLIPEYALTIN